MRRVFFSFHYENDIWRANQVRNSDRFLSHGRFVDAADWESLKRQGRKAIEDWINSQLNGTSVTIVLIGAQTADRPWVQYEIDESKKRGNGLLGIRLDGLKNQNGFTEVSGRNPLPYSSNVCRWVPGKSEKEIEKWIEEAWKDARG